VILAAGITALGVFVASHHEPTPATCERNPGVLVESGDWHYGAVRNSLCRPSVFVHRHLTIADAGGVRLGVSLGPQTGYHVPFTAYLRVTYGPVALYVIPPIPPLTRSGVKPPVVGLAFRYTF
jgi:hypothetical protein